MLATRELLTKALGQAEIKNESELQKTIDRLCERHLLFERGAVRGFALWPHTSVHLDDEFEDAKSELGEPAEPMRMVSALLEPRQIVARRHYIETGNLRHFELQFMPARDYGKLCEAGAKPHLGVADGCVIILLPENEGEYRKSHSLLKGGRHPGPDVLIGLARPPLGILGIAKDLQAWEHIQKSVKELTADAFARRELRNQIRTTRDRLNQQIDVLLGWNLKQKLITWYRNGQPDHLEPDGLSSKLSEISKEIYSKCPVITNELLNRRMTSSAASRARTVLVEAIAKNPEKEFLGMDDSKNPPEMAIYLSILRAGKLHIRDGDHWKFVIPARNDDPCKLRPAFDAIEALLKKHDGQRVKAPIIFDALRNAPIGTRDGIIPLIVSLYLAARSGQTAVYEDSTYTHSLGGDELQRLMKEPECFEFQHCAIEGPHFEAFQAISDVFGVPKMEHPRLLDAVKPLVKFIAEVPEYSRNTKKLSPGAVLFRQTLLTARDPAALIFRELPESIGVAANDGKGIAKKVAQFVAEIKNSYDCLLMRLSSAITDVFATNVGISEFREELAIRARAIAPKLADNDLKSFVLRLGDGGLEFRNWLESLANHLSKKSAARWTDIDEENFDQRLGVLARRFLRAEASQSDIAKKGLAGEEKRVVRLMLTRPDGTEHGELIHWAKVEETKVAELETIISNLIKQHGRAGLGATANALWNHLQS